MASAKFLPRENLTSEHLHPIRLQVKLGRQGELAAPPRCSIQSFPVMLTVCADGYRQEARPYREEAYVVNPRNSPRSISPLPGRRPRRISSTSMDCLRRRNGTLRGSQVLTGFVQARTASTDTRVIGSSAWPRAGGSPRVSTTVSGDDSGAPRLCHRCVIPPSAVARESCESQFRIDLVALEAFLFRREPAISRAGMLILENRSAIAQTRRPAT